MVVQTVPFAQRNHPLFLVGFGTQNSENVFLPSQVLHHALRTLWHSASLPSHLLLPSDVDNAARHQTGQGQDY